MWFFRRQRRLGQDRGLSPCNVPADWAESGIWRSWDAPRNEVAGESHYLPALTSLTGRPRPSGYLKPVEVCFIREPKNPYDTNAWRVEVSGKRVGYARRALALQLASGLDGHGINTFRVCGVIRGGSDDAPNLGVHVWLDRRTTDGPVLSLGDDSYEVAWPPYDDEGS
jgi:hypothetical protein